MAFTSIDDAISNVTTYGQWPIAWSGKSTTVTAALTTCGYVTGSRIPNTITVPSFGAGVSNVYCTQFQSVNNSNSGSTMLAIEKTLGTLTISGNVFGAGSAMPTRTPLGGSSVQLATSAALVVTTVLSATTPTITITYTNQAGVGGKTATMVLPTNPAVNSVYLITPHLAAGDTGIQAITNISTSAGASGVLTAYGLIPIGLMNGGSASAQSNMDRLATSAPLYPIAAGDVLTHYRFVSTGAADVFSVINLIPA